MKTYIAKKIGEVINGLEVTGILRNENGLPVYSATCQECGARGVPVKHEQFSTGAAKCISSMHNRSRYQPTTIQKVRAEEADKQRRVEEEQQRPVREAEQRLNETHRKLVQIGKEEVLNGKPDPWWEIPADAVGKSMSLDRVRDFVREQSTIFRAAHPEYYPCKENLEAIMGYLVAQQIAIPTASCFERAVERLGSLGLLKERPAPPEPQPAPVMEEPAEPSNDGLTDGWDIETGQPRKYTEREIEHMSSDDFKKAFRMWVTRDGDRRPKFNRSMYA